MGDLLFTRVSLSFWIIFSKMSQFFKNQIFFVPRTFESRSQEIYSSLIMLISSSRLRNSLV